MGFEEMLQSCTKDNGFLEIFMFELLKKIIKSMWPMGLSCS